MPRQERQNNQESNEIIRKDGAIMISQNEDDFSEELLLEDSILNGSITIAPQYKLLADLFVKLSKEILTKEGYQDVKVQIVPNVWATHANKYAKVVQYGELMFTNISKNSYYQARRYYYCYRVIGSDISLITTLSSSNRNILPVAVRYASVLLEEVGHIVAPLGAAHGNLFLCTYTKLWDKYFLNVYQEISKCIGD